ncbi:hypothetical protein AXF42_Ash018845 [Apostasia shenzhenica]|uniref:Uncharacterized protein n=1 Tax=Apostasia shenzhenica TaxID=1088818 RepID=A0A2I0B181_9ASPA|nr:hypothetical protein AXF42_Ash018845 [Apostasia shenzhenica]
MASYYYQNREPSYSESPFSLHLCFFLLTLLLFICFSWHTNYGTAIESIVDQIRLLVIASPLVLLLVVHWLSSGADARRRVPFALALPEEPAALHRAGGSPWGVGLLLLLLLLMVSYHSSFHVRFFPVISR